MSGGKLGSCPIHLSHVPLHGMARNARLRQSPPTQPNPAYLHTRLAPARIVPLRADCRHDDDRPPGAAGMCMPPVCCRLCVPPVHVHTSQWAGRMPGIPYLGAT